MKICWDNLEGVYLSRNGNFRKSRKSRRVFSINKCVVCGHDYLRDHASKTNFCSNSCSSKVQVCTEATRLKLSESHKGQISGNKGKPSKMRGIPRSEETKNKIRKSSLGKKMSKEALKNMSAAGKGRIPWNKGIKFLAITGKNNPNYNPNLSDEERQIRRIYPEYIEWRKAVYELHSYTCQCCDQVGGNLNAHHIESYSNNPELRTTIENGITLCETCHKDFHHNFGYGNNTKKQLYVFLLEHKKEKQNG